MHLYMLYIILSLSLYVIQSNICSESISRTTWTENGWLSKLVQVSRLPSRCDQVHLSCSRSGTHKRALPIPFLKTRIAMIWNDFTMITMILPCEINWNQKSVALLFLIGLSCRAKNSWSCIGVGYVGFLVAEPYLKERAMANPWWTLWFRVADWELFQPCETRNSEAFWEYTGVSTLWWITLRHLSD